MNKRNGSITKMIKIVYFDEGTAEDYLEVMNGGKTKIEEEKRKERNGELAGKIEASLGREFDLLAFIKGKLNISGYMNMKFDQKKILKNIITNTILTDFLKMSYDDKRIEKFNNGAVYSEKNSISRMKMYTPYMIVAKDVDADYDITKFDEALEKAKGYYEMLIDIDDSISVLRFNISQFRNNYGLADLTKMKLAYFGICVGTCNVSQLNMENEFDIEKDDKIQTPEEITGIGNQDQSSIDKELKVYDVILAGIKYE